MSPSGGNLERVLRLMAEKKASDVFLSARTPILIKIHGQIMQLTDQILTPSQPRQLLSEMISPTQMEELDETGELNLGITIPGVAIFRLSAFKQRGSVAAVFRYIPSDIPALDSLNVPDVLSNLILEKRGLILLAGATGAGKSTTLAAMLEHRNQRMTGHILTIEDPLEFLFSNKKSIVNQREVGRDTQSLQVGLKNALRQAPDCILIGEIRDRETMTAALSYALSGHLVLSTLHTNSAPESVGRLLEIGLDPFNFSDSLLAILAQRLVRRLCPHCREAQPATPEALQALARQYLLSASDGTAQPSTEEVQRQIIHWQHRHDQGPQGQGLMLYRAHEAGCPHCEHHGYLGRLGLHELMLSSDTIRSQIRHRASGSELRQSALAAGMKTLRQDGIEKMLHGLTDLSEVLAATNL